MKLLPPELLVEDRDTIGEIDRIMMSIYRLITFSRQHLADDVLDRFLASTNELQELVGIKNAQMEAQTEREAEIYLRNLDHALHFVIEEIKNGVEFETELQLFQLFRIIDPEAHARHPNRYRDKLVQIGGHLCPEPAELGSLVSQLIHNLARIDSPVMRAIYLHHELIRIHPFADGNGRTARIAKNWILMYHLYPPIFIRDDAEKTDYIGALAASFARLEQAPDTCNEDTVGFFAQETHRILDNARRLADDLQ